MFAVTKLMTAIAVVTEIQTNFFPVELDFIHIASTILSVIQAYKSRYNYCISLILGCNHPLHHHVILTFVKLRHSYN